MVSVQEERVQEPHALLIAPHASEEVPSMLRLTSQQAVNSGADRRERNQRACARISSLTLHQERLGVDDSKVMVNIDRYGNTTAGTIPLGLRDAVEQGRLHKGDLVLIVTVGAGYTTGAVLLRWAY